MVRSQGSEAPNACILGTYLKLRRYAVGRVSTVVDSLIIGVDAWVPTVGTKVAWYTYWRYCLITTHCLCEEVLTILFIRVRLVSERLYMLSTASNGWIPIPLS